MGLWVVWSGSALQLYYAQIPGSNNSSRHSDVDGGKQDFSSHFVYNHSPWIEIQIRFTYNKYLDNSPFFLNDNEVYKFAGKTH